MNWIWRIKPLWVAALALWSAQLASGQSTAPVAGPTSVATNQPAALDTEAPANDGDNTTGTIDDSRDDKSTDSVVISPENTVDDRDGRMLTGDQVEKYLEERSTDSIANPAPERPEYRKIPPDLERKLRIFQALRKEYLSEQEVLIKKYKGATDRERALIRDRIRQKREEWLKRSREIKETYRERLPDLMRELPSHQKALRAAQDAVRDQVRSQEDDRRHGLDR